MKLDLCTTASNGTSPWIGLAQLAALNKTFQATIEGIGAVSANVVFEFSNDAKAPVKDNDSTLTLSGTTIASDGFVNAASWQFVRVNISGLSVGAVVTATAGG